MAIGTIRLRPLKKNVRNDIVPPVAKPAPVETPPSNELHEQKETVFDYTQLRGIDNLRIAVVAESEIVAKDYVCSLYTNLIEITRGTRISAYISKHETLMMLDETKRNISDIISTPKNTKSVRSDNMFTNGEYEIVIGEAANQRLSVNVYFSCLSYGSISAATGADAVFVILNKSNPIITSQTVASLRNSLLPKLATWIVMGFEREHIFYSSELDYPPTDQYMKSVAALYGVPSQVGESLCFVQQYGGLVVEEEENGLPVCKTVSNCREYTPVACCLPLLSLITDIQKENICEGTAFSLIRRCIKDIIIANDDATETWRIKAKTEEVK